jgi:pimeloyl-ACP methyl ester carboxylesterase
VKRRRIEVSISGRSVDLEVAEAGSGGKPLLLVHGLGGAKEDFTDWLDPLADRGWHAVAPDLRGHGSSAHPPDESDYSLDIIAADLVALLDALGWTTCVVLGHSMGGMAVQTAVLAAADRFGALVLMDTSHGVVDLDPEVVELAILVLRTEGIEAFAAASDAIEGPLDTPAYLKYVAEHPEHKAFADRKLLACSAQMYAALAVELTAPHDRLDALARLSMPTLVMVGEQDEPFLGHCERMAKAIPGARLAVIPDGGHSPQFESPDAWWAELTAFLDGLELQE